MRPRRCGLDDAARTARQAADALGVETAQIASSLVFRARCKDRAIRPLLVLTSGIHRVDIIKVADLLELAEVA
ncbi:MAG: YbaK/EbsC family protein [Dermatophilaceae bacterium]